MRRSSASLLLAVGCCTVADAFLAGGAHALAIRADASSAPILIEMAKKKSKPRKPDKKQGGASLSGFAAQPAESLGAPPSPASMDAPMAAPASPSSARPDAPLDRRLDDVLAAAGMMQSDESLIEAKREPQSPLSSIPVKGQEVLERFFGGGALIFGSAFILAGIAVAFEAVCKVAKVELPVAVDEAIVQYIFPSLTPSILILFFFSISLGLLKQVSARACAHHTCSPVPCFPICPVSSVPSSFELLLLRLHAWCPLLADTLPGVANGPSTVAVAAQLRDWRRSVHGGR